MRARRAGPRMRWLQPLRRRHRQDHRLLVPHLPLVDLPLVHRRPAGRGSSPPATAGCPSSASAGTGPGRSTSVKVSPASFSCSATASETSMVFWAFSTRVTTSPIPRMREAMRSGWNGSRPSSFSPTPDELDRLARDAADRQRGAAPGVRVELAQDHPGQRHALVERLRDVHRVWPVIASATSSVSSGAHASRIRTSSAIRLLVDLQAPRGVHDHRVVEAAPRVVHGVAHDPHRVGRPRR